ncbi:hypothetical protein [Salinigranum rubrum]|nr:hypothetical protein [Salinigranum rubrum]
MSDVENSFQIGDPVMDAAQGRPMVVLDAPDETVADWSDANGYNLTSNYANSKFGCTDDEPVVECVYVSDVRSEPSKTYTFPVSRIRLIDVHHADDGRRVGARAVRAFLVEAFVVATAEEREALKAICEAAGWASVKDEALEFAKAAGEVPEYV